MTLIECLVPLPRGDRIVVAGDISGSRYVFTLQKRIQPVDDLDAPGLLAKTVHTSSCGCRGGKGTQDMALQMFGLSK